MLRRALHGAEGMAVIDRDDVVVVVVVAWDRECEVSAAYGSATNSKESTDEGCVREQSRRRYFNRSREEEEKRRTRWSWSWSSLERAKTQTGTTQVDPPLGSDGAIPTAGGPIRRHVCALTRGSKIHTDEIDFNALASLQLGQHGMLFPSFISSANQAVAPKAVAAFLPVQDDPKTRALASWHHLFLRFKTERRRFPYQTPNTALPYNRALIT
ncbi:hypothetical protein B0T18DRAFT_69204 [Schizothecium vesticola]|uniref:Uncharacterized protein n=1 Tax=Schizothecium vesticola TaxID=314040 RepID=A0AA40F5G4_9PEZI|nr:hypothetical protein B0T18DRAFT_69204 [Schizothecium vesticola]